jgi:hypothetical protein
MHDDLVMFPSALIAKVECLASNVVASEPALVLPPPL